MKYIPSPDELSAEVLGLIVKHGPLSCNAIYDRLEMHVDRATLARHLDGMVNFGELWHDNGTPFVYYTPPQPGACATAGEPEDPVCWTISRSMELYISRGGEMIMLSAADTRALDLFLRRIDLGEGE